MLDLVNAGLQAVRVDDSACWTSIQFDVPNASEPQGVSLYGAVFSCGCSWNLLGSCRAHGQHVTLDGSAIVASPKAVSDVEVVVRDGTDESVSPKLSAHLFSSYTVRILR